MIKLNLLPKYLGNFIGKTFSFLFSTMTFQFEGFLHKLFVTYCCGFICIKGDTNILQKRYF